MEHHLDNGAFVKKRYYFLCALEEASATWEQRDGLTMTPVGSILGMVLLAGHEEGEKSQQFW